MLFVVALGSLMFGAFLIALIARYSPDGAALRLEEQRHRDAAAGRTLYPAIPIHEWRVLIIDLLEALGFHIAMEHQIQDSVEIIARSSEPLRGGRFLVHAIHSAPGDVVERTQVLKLQDSVQGETIKGILMTPYTIDMDGLSNLEAPMEFFDGQKLRELIEQYLPKRLDAIEGYRGFGASRALSALPGGSSEPQPLP